MAEGLVGIDKAVARDPQSFSIWVTRIMHLARTPGKAGLALQAAVQAQETRQFEMAALDSLLAQHNMRPARILTRSASSPASLQP